MLKSQNQVFTRVSIFAKNYGKMDFHGNQIGDMVPTLHKIVHYLKDKIGVVYFQCCVIFDTL